MDGNIAGERENRWREEEDEEEGGKKREKEFKSTSWMRFGPLQLTMLSVTMPVFLSEAEPGVHSTGVTLLSLPFFALPK